METQPFVLVVDDEISVREVIVKILNLFGIEEISVANNAQEAFDQMELRGTPDLMLTDYWMPAMIGPDLIRQARQQQGYFPIILLSGDGQTQLKAEECEAELQVKFVGKPVNIPAFMEIIRAVAPNVLPPTIQ